MIQPLLGWVTYTDAFSLLTDGSIIQLSTELPESQICENPLISVALNPDFFEIMHRIPQEVDTLILKCINDSATFAVGVWTLAGNIFKKVTSGQKIKVHLYQPYVLSPKDIYAQTFINASLYSLVKFQPERVESEGLWHPTIYVPYLILEKK